MHFKFFVHLITLKTVCVAERRKWSLLFQEKRQQQNGKTDTNKERWDVYGGACGWQQKKWPKYHSNQRNVIIWFSHLTRAQRQKGERHKWMIFALVCNLLTVFVCAFFVASFGLFIVTLAMANKVIMNSFFSHMELTLWPLSVHCWLFFLAYFFFFLLSVVCVAFYLNANLNKAKDRVEIGNWNEDIFKTHVTFVVFLVVFRPTL